MNKIDEQHLQNLRTWRASSIEDLTLQENELALKQKKFKEGNDLRERAGLHMGQDMGNVPPFGLKYLEALENDIYYNLPGSIANTENRIDQLTTQIEELMAVAVPPAEAVAGEEEIEASPRAEVAVASEAPLLQQIKKPSSSSSSSSDGDGKKRKRNKPRGKKTRGNKPRGKKTRGNKPRGKKTRGNKTRGNKTRGKKTRGKKTRSHRSTLRNK